MINIHLNGEARQVPEGLTLAALLDWLHLPADRMAVERNLEIVPRGQWNQTMIGEGDRLEVVQFVGEQFGEESDKYETPWFRGVGDSRYKLVPSLYRTRAGREKYADDELRNEFARSVASRRGARAP